MQLGSYVAMYRLADIAPIRPLAWELPYAAGVTISKKEEKTTTTKKNRLLRIKPLQPP